MLSREVSVAWLTCHTALSGLLMVIGPTFHVASGAVFQFSVNRYLSCGQLTLRELYYEWLTIKTVTVKCVTFTDNLKSIKTENNFEHDTYVSKSKKCRELTQYRTSIQKLQYITRRYTYALNDKHS